MQRPGLLVCHVSQRACGPEVKYRGIPVIVISGLAGNYVAVSKSVPVIEKPPDEEKVLWEVAKALGEPL